jgi:hypothetical protein
MVIALATERICRTSDKKARAKYYTGPAWQFRKKERKPTFRSRKPMS